ncbi:hypothetical protein [Oxynema aestuarii]|uniref:Uncharacterized protein n=1 Tax=Oxynema aestuarii AP17 TaxID=2064643 RepID=A0A6H1TUT5_9CYAN|nr:hypothetical protein [Oxynema aestuarii]QIZ69523.1 hypothetical protein HCG48_02105 [Oxynema aestuarii AP17]RMH76047.1 MAG: hypothetical protein D6680_09820 [Cyanobacteria bacterium J007]
MLEIVVWSVFVGSLGIEALVAGGWLRWRHFAIARTHQEEEEMFDAYSGNGQLPAIDMPPTSFLPTGNVEQRNSSDGESIRHDPLPELRSPSPHDPPLGEWEYKIVRANFDLFRNPDIFHQLCEEESQAGWVLLEKLDDRRVRFKRALVWRKMLKEDGLPFDPYRVHYGPSMGTIHLLGGIAALTLMILPAYLGYILVSNTLNKHTPQIAPPAPTVDLSSPEPPMIP